MALPINAGQFISDAAIAAGAAAIIDAGTELSNAPFLNSPSVIGTGMTNVELLLYGAGALGAVGAALSMLTKKKLLGGAEKNVLGSSIGLIAGTFLYETQLSKFVRGG